MFLERPSVERCSYSHRMANEELTYLRPQSTRHYHDFPTSKILMNAVSYFSISRLEHACRYVNQRNRLVIVHSISAACTKRTIMYYSSSLKYAVLLGENSYSCCRKTCNLFVFVHLDWSQSRRLVIVATAYRYFHQ